MDICREWLRFTSQRPLQLRLSWAHASHEGSLVLNLSVHEGKDNIVATRNQSHRSASISLTVTTSLLNKLSGIIGPSPGLEELVLPSQNDMRLTLPRVIQWSPCLCRLHLTGVAFPTPLHLYSAKDLVDLHIHEVLDPSRFPPEVLTNALSGTVQLRSLSLHFLSTAHYLTSPPPSGERIVLPVLTHLNFRGFICYLDGLVARIDAPRLGNIQVTLFNKIITDLSKLSKFIDRIEIHKSHRRAHVLSSTHAISISLTRPGASSCLKLKFFYVLLSGQLFSLTRVCTHFSAFLLNVEDLRISATRSPRWNNSRYGKRWLEPINSFTGVKCFHVSGNLSTDIIQALQQPDRPSKTVLPALHKLCIREPGPRNPLLREAVVSLMVSRRLSGCVVEVEYERIRVNGLSGTGSRNTEHQNHTLTSSEQDLFFGK
jgi:hypothetical protein